MQLAALFRRVPVAVAGDRAAAVCSHERLVAHRGDASVGAEREHERPARVVALVGRWSTTAPRWSCASGRSLPTASSLNDASP
jgi:hypothetical protein